MPPMNRTFRPILLLLPLIFSLSTPSWARLVIGVTPAVTPGAGDRRTLDDCAELLGNQLGEAVYLRSIDSEAQMVDWVARFRELDAALITSQAFATGPAGELVKVTDLAGDGEPGLVVVTYAGQSPERIDRLRTLSQLPRTEPGRRLLQRAAPRTPPPAPRAVYGESLLSPAMSPQTPAASPAQPERARPLPKAEIPADTPPLPRTAPVQPVAAAPPAPASPPAQAPPTVMPTVSATQPATAPTPPAAIVQAPITAPEKPVMLAPATPTSPAAPAKASRLRLVFFVSLILITGILLKLALLVRHWRRHRGAGRPVSPPAVFTARPLDPPPAIQPPSVAAPDLPAVPPPLPLGPGVAVVASAPIPLDFPELPPPWETQDWARPLPPLDVEEIVSLEDLVLETGSGTLDAETLPHLLQHCAGLAEPVVMTIRTPHRETHLHFSAGKISHVGVVYPRAVVSFAEKTGQMMVRDSLLSAAKLDQALEIVRRNPGNGLGAALRTVDALDPEGYRSILNRHAKTQLFFLLLFPEGEYLVAPPKQAATDDEAIALEIDALLSDADYHQAEWTAIRKDLPGLTTAVTLLPDGREKLGKLQLSSAQMQLLEQIDGSQPLDALCATTTLPDYETCRFLYMMTRIGVLSVTPIS